jgi:uncharacterized membrane protein YhaH (DUF805 family)
MTHPHDRTKDIGRAGLAGALAAQGADRLHDRGWSAPATGAGLLLAVISLLIADAGQHSIIVVLIAVVLLDSALLLALALVVWLAQRSALDQGMRPIDELAPERI